MEAGEIELHDDDNKPSFGPPEFAGARGYANDKGSFRGHIVSRQLMPGEPVHERLLFVLAYGFTKFPEEDTVKFHVNEGLLKLIDGQPHRAKELELVASWSLVVQLGRSNGNGSYTATEVHRFERSLKGGGQYSTRTAAVIAEELAKGGYKVDGNAGTDDGAEGELIFPVAEIEIELDIDGETVKDTIYSVTGAVYKTPSYSETIDVSSIADGEDFVVYYTMELNAIGYGGDSQAESKMGDPLEYGTGILTRHGDIGEYFDPADHQILDLRTLPNEDVEVDFPVHDPFYYLLYRSEDLESWDQPLAGLLGASIDGSSSSTGGIATILDGTAPGNRGFYKVQRRWEQNSADSDGDGILDVYELRHPTLLDFTNPADAQQDPDGDGLTNLAEYQNGTDPAVLDDTTPGPDAYDGLYPGKIQPIELSGVAYAFDINGDQHMDWLAVGSTSIDVALANPDGTFQSTISSSIPRFAFTHTLADINDDTIPDLVIVVPVTETVAVYSGAPNGSFTETGVHVLGDDSIAMLATGDINGDGRPDIFAGSERNRALRLITQLSDDTFSAPAILDFDFSPLAAATGNINGDAFPDLVVTLSSGQAILIEGEITGATGGRTSHATGSSPANILMHDLNGDGLDDLITANKFSDDISVLLAATDSGFVDQERYPVGDFPLGLALENMNADAHLDLVVSHGESDFHTVLFGDGAGGFLEKINIPSSANDQNARVYDWNGDGHMDVAAVAGSRFVIIAGNGDGTFDSRTLIEGTESLVTVVDWSAADPGNGKNTFEIAGLSQGASAISIWRHDLSAGASELVQSVDVSGEVQAWVIEDFDGDRQRDIVVGSGEPQFFGDGNNALTFLKGAGDGTLEAGVETPVDAAGRLLNVVGADVNGDGLKDIVARIDDGTPQLLPLLNNGDASFSPAAPLAPGDIVTLILARDLDGDGCDEIIVFGDVGGQRGMQIFGFDLNTATWIPGTKLAYPVYAKQHAWHDIDGDTIEELFTARYDPADGATKVDQWRVFGGALAEPSVVFSTVDVTSVRQFHLADATGDGHADILLNSLQIFPADGTGNWQSADPEPYFFGGNELLPVELNGDGRIDVLSWDTLGKNIGVSLHR